MNEPARKNPPQQPQGKNVLFLYVDDLRPEINCYGKTKLITPNLDRLARRSLVFSRAYCQVPVCGPSRVSTLTGTYATPSTGWGAADVLSRGLPSLPGQFRANGYDTISIGKVYHVNNDDPESWTRRYTHTFHEQELVCNGYCSGYQLRENLDGRSFATTRRNTSALTECVDAPDSAYPDAKSADRAVADIEAYSKSGRPLFLAVGFYRPHLPWAVPKKYWDLYKREEIDLAESQFFPKGAVSRNTWGDLMHYGDQVVNAADAQRTDLSAETFPRLPEDKQRELVHGYWASVSFLDAQIGRVLDALDQTGMADNTMIVLASDNGWHLGEHLLWSKCSNYEESVRIPLMIAASGITDGKATGSLVELVDLYPTLCEWAGLPAPDHLEGVSMMPLLRDPSRKWKKAAFNVWGGARSMRTERYRLTAYDAPMPSGSDFQLPGSGRYELYDYETDPDGNANIATQPETQALLRDLLARMDAGWQAARPDSPSATPLEEA